VPVTSRRPFCVALRSQYFPEPHAGVVVHGAPTLRFEEEADEASSASSAEAPQAATRSAIEMLAANERNRDIE